MKTRHKKRRLDRRRRALLLPSGQAWERRIMRNMRRMHTDAAYREKIERLIF